MIKDRIAMFNVAWSINEMMKFHNLWETEVFVGKDHFTAQFNDGCIFIWDLRHGSGMKRFKVLPRTFMSKRKIRKILNSQPWSKAM